MFEQAFRNIDDVLSADYFYMLFTFTNLDSLAFEIEEALITNKIQASGRVKRHPDFIRRGELVIAEET